MTNPADKLEAALEKLILSLIPGEKFTWMNGLTADQVTNLADHLRPLATALQEYRAAKEDLVKRETPTEVFAKIEQLQTDLLTAASLAKAMEAIVCESVYSEPSLSIIAGLAKDALTQSETIAKHSQAIWRLLKLVLEEEHQENLPEHYGRTRRRSDAVRALPPELVALIEEVGV